MRKRVAAPWFHEKTVLFILIALLAIGLVMVASASMIVSEQQYHYPFHYFFRDCTYAVLGILLVRCMLYVPMAFWQRHAGKLMLLGLFLAFLVLIHGIGRVVNGSRRWIHIGPLTLQVSELVKLMALFYLGSYLERFQRQVQHHFIGFIKPMLLLLLLAILLLMEPDFGSVAILTMMFLSLLFLADVSLWPFVLLLVCVLGALILLAVTSPYRLARITSFLNPWAHQYSSGYQLTQSLIAFGRGGIFGVGLGNSIQKLFYLPEAHTDFLFAIISEELGLLGELLIVALFATLFIRMLTLAKRGFKAGRLFGAYVVLGGGVWLGLQAMVNIGVNAGLLPTKGLTLPLISYGGSSMLSMCLLLGITMRFSYELDLAGATVAPRFYTRKHGVE